MTLEELARERACDYAREDWHKFGIERDDAWVDNATKEILEQLKENQRLEEDKKNVG